MVAELANFALETTPGWMVVAPDATIATSPLMVLGAASALDWPTRICPEVNREIDGELFSVETFAQFVGFCSAVVTVPPDVPPNLFPAICSPVTAVPQSIAAARKSKSFPVMETA